MVKLSESFQKLTALSQSLIFMAIALEALQLFFSNVLLNDI